MSSTSTCRTRRRATSTASAAPAATAPTASPSRSAIPAKAPSCSAVERMIRMRLPVVADHTGAPDPQRSAARSSGPTRPSRASCRTRRATAGPRPGGGKRASATGRQPGRVAAAEAQRAPAPGRNEPAASVRPAAGGAGVSRGRPGRFSVSSKRCPLQALFFRNSARKTVSAVSWNCPRPVAARINASTRPRACPWSPATARRRR